MSFKTGLTPVNRLGSTDSGQVNRYRGKNNNAAAFYAGMPVRVSANGFLQVADDTDNPVGVFAGALWIDGVSKRPVRSLYAPAATSTEGGLIDGLNTVTWGGWIALVNDDPMQTFVIKSDTSIAATAIGAFAQVTLQASGSSFTQRSICEIDIANAGVSNANAMFKIVGIPTYDNQVGSEVSAAPTSDGELTNTWGVQNNQVQVIFAKHLYGRGT